MIKRATWHIDADLLYKMKRIALDDRTTLTQIANQAFRDYVQKRGIPSSTYSEREVKTLAKDMHTQLEKDKKRGKK